MAPATIIWTRIDEAPALASHALLPIVQAFTRGTDITVEHGWANWPTRQKPTSSNYQTLVRQYLNCRRL